MTKILKIEDIQDAVGKELGISNWMEVKQEDVNAFADLTNDHQFIHIDPEKAAQTPFGGTIAHGFLSLSWLSHFAAEGAGVWIEDAVMGVNYGFDKVRFLNPVRVGSRIRGRSSLISVEEKSKGQYLFKTSNVVEIEGVDKPALMAEWLTMVITKA